MGPLALRGGIPQAHSTSADWPGFAPSRAMGVRTCKQSQRGSTCRPIQAASAPSMAGKRGASPEMQLLHEYLIAHSVHSTAAMDGLQQESLLHTRARMLSPPDTIPILQLLLKLTAAMTVIEVGTFTGYATLGLALGLPKDGLVYTLDINAEYVEIGRPWWQSSGVDGKIKFVEGPASESLSSLLEELGPASVDLGFIDADKENYDSYFEQLLLLLRPGGVLVIDNVLWGAAVIDSNDDSPRTQAIRKLNHKLYHDSRVQIAMLKNSDGISVAYKL